METIIRLLKRFKVDSSFITPKLKLNTQPDGIQTVFHHADNLFEPKIHYTCQGKLYNALSGTVKLYVLLFALNKYVRTATLPHRKDFLLQTNASKNDILVFWF